MKHLLFFLILFSFSLFATARVVDALMLDDYRTNVDILEFE